MFYFIWQMHIFVDRSFLFKLPFIIHDAKAKPKEKSSLKSIWSEFVFSSQRFDNFSDFIWRWKKKVLKTYFSILKFQNCEEQLDINYLVRFQRSSPRGEIFVLPPKKGNSYLTRSLWSERFAKTSTQSSAQIGVK